MVLGAGVSDGGLLVDVDVPQRHLAHRGGAGHRGAGRAGLPRGRGAPHPAQPARRDRAGAGLVGPPGRARAGPHAVGPRGPRQPAHGRQHRDASARSPATTSSSSTPRRWARRGRRVVVAGDLTGRRRRRRARGDPRHLVGAAAPPGARRRSPRCRAADAARVVVVDRPGSVQTEIAVGRPGPDRSTPARLGAATRCCPSCSVAPRAPASTPCCARRRATPTASAARSDRGSRAGRSSRRGRCARR